MLTRYRGDTQRLAITLNKNGAVVPLSTITKAEFAIKKKASTLVILCVKDVDDATGVVYVPFTDSSLDETGKFTFDVQVEWLDGTRTTFLLDKIQILDDINKTT